MFKRYKLKYVTYGFGKHGPKMFGVLMIRSNLGWVVEVWPCDICGSQVSDPVEWSDCLSWWDAKKLFREWYQDYDKYVNSRI